ncbi:MAG: hypothetical protein LBR64_02225 [Dysgonamonadaceae bacterium]|jgi:hypothetical protein|nr:hypothetical protein [Dysgonamonadaceae bacterium]
MKFRYFLEQGEMQIEIREPIGFDDFKLQIERTDHHGISAAVSVSKIGFTDTAADIVQTAYDTDIDTEIIFRVQMQESDGGEWANIYVGKLDLGTYESLISGDDGCRVSCSVGEAGAKTIFNNRYETSVALDRMTSLDGDTLPEYENLKKDIVFPAKPLLFKDYSILTDDIAQDSMPQEGMEGQNDMAQELMYTVPIGSNSIIDEFGLFKADATPSYIVGHRDNTGDDNSLRMQLPGDIEVFQNTGENKYNDTENAVAKEITVNVDIKVTADWHHSLFPSGSLTSANPILEMGLEFSKIGVREDSSTYVSATIAWDYLASPTEQYPNGVDPSDKEFEIEFHGPVTLSANEKLGLFFYISIDVNNSIIYMQNLTVKMGSYINITLLDVIEPSTHKMAFVHETMSRLAEIISGLTVKSDWYGKWDSEVNPYSVYGGGSMKALINGWALRNGKLESGYQPPITLTFKDAFNALNAIDNIGWGFSEENGILFVRLERWQWFYKDDVILTINGANDKKRVIDQDKVLTRLKIGYDKFVDSEMLNSVDTFFTEMEFTEGLQTIDKLNEKISKFVADDYAIELTRRKSFSPDTSNWDYDDDVFVVVLYYDITSSSYLIETETKDRANLISSLVLNGKISPRRNAIRQAEEMFEVNSVKYNLQFSSGKGNTDAIFGFDAAAANERKHEDSANYETHKESDAVAKINPLLKPETLSFEYPITLDDYNAIMTNPYGKIVVDGEECYIKKVTANFIQGTADFELIPVASQTS